MPKLLLTLLLFALSFNINAQTSNIKSYTIIPTSGQSDVSAYVNALDKADMESYRYKTINDTITFDTGVKVVLLSARQLYLSGVNIDVNNYSDDRDPAYVKPTFQLTPSGFLMALYTHKEK